MGTRSLTFIYEDGEAIVNKYRQFDGYPSGHGKDLFDFLSSGKLVNGLSGDPEPVFNGMGCLAAAMVAKFKKGPAVSTCTPRPRGTVGRTTSTTSMAGSIAPADCQGY